MSEPTANVLFGDPIEDNPALRTRIEAAERDCPSLTPPQNTMDETARGKAIVNVLVRCASNANGVKRARILTEAIFFLFGDFINVSGTDADTLHEAKAKAKSLIAQALPLGRADRDLVRALQSYQDSLF